MNVFNHIVESTGTIITGRVTLGKRRTLAGAMRKRKGGVGQTKTDKE